MKIDQIKSLVPEGEPFEESAITPEGVWLSTKHMENIENALQGNGNISDSLTEKVNEIEALQTSNGELETQLNAANETISEKDATIAQLQADLKELGKQESGEGTANAIDKDKSTETTKVPSYLDPNNPINKAVQAEKAYREKYAKK